VGGTIAVDKDPVLAVEISAAAATAIAAVLV
jgi:hypothetical protein